MSSDSSASSAHCDRLSVRRRGQAKGTRSALQVLAIAVSFAIFTQLLVAFESAYAGASAPLKYRVLSIELPVMSSWIALESDAMSVGSHKSPLSQLTDAASILAIDLRSLQSQLRSPTWPIRSSAYARTMAAATSPSLSAARALAHASGIANAATLLSKVNRNQSPFFYDMAIFNSELKVPSIAAVHDVLTCQADVAIVAVAIEAFTSSVKSVTPTESLLLGTSNGGPYLTSWPHNSPRYTIKLVAGKEFISAPSTSGAVPATSIACYPAFF